MRRQLGVCAKAQEPLPFANKRVMRASEARREVTAQQKALKSFLEWGGGCKKKINGLVRMEQRGLVSPLLIASVYQLVRD